MEIRSAGVESWRWDGEGYRPLPLNSSWMVAVLSWEPSAAIGGPTQAERHVRSGEVFVLLSGRSILLTRPEGGAVSLTGLDPRTVYHMPRGVWYALVATGERSLLVVEDRDTHHRDTELRVLDAVGPLATGGERERLKGYGAKT
jgi:hypothetical protein